MPTDESPERNAYWRVSRVAAHFDVAASTIWRWTEQGRIPKPVKIGGATRWRRADIEAINLADQEAA